jgi:hypothetical protein
MMDFFRKHRTKFFVSIGIIFVLGAFGGFGGYFLAPKGGSPNDTIAEVNGQKISLGLFQIHLNRALNGLPPGAAADKNTRKQKEQEALRDLVQGAVVDQEAKRYGIFVPDQQVVSALMQNPNFQEKGSFSPALYQRVLQYQLKMNPRDFEEEQAQAIALFRLRWLFDSVTKTTPKEADMMFQVEGENYQKSWKANHPKDAPKPETVRNDFTKQLHDMASVWALNQWFNQAVQRSKIKTHLEILEGGQP